MPDFQQQRLLETQRERFGAYAIEGGDGDGEKEKYETMRCRSSRQAYDEEHGEIITKGGYMNSCERRRRGAQPMGRMSRTIKRRKNCG